MRRLSRNSGSLNLLGPSGPVQACSGIDLSDSVWQVSSVVTLHTYEAPLFVTLSVYSVISVVQGSIHCAEAHCGLLPCNKGQLIPSEHIFTCYDYILLCYIIPAAAIGVLNNVTLRDTFNLRMVDCCLLSQESRDGVWKWKPVWIDSPSYFKQICIDHRSMIYIFASVNNVNLSTVFVIILTELSASLSLLNSHLRLAIKNGFSHEPW